MKVRKARGNLLNERSKGNWKSRRSRQSKDERKGGRTVKTARPPFFAPMELLLLPKAPRLGDRLAPYPVAKVGTFIRIEKNQ